MSEPSTPRMGGCVESIYQAFGIPPIIMGDTGTAKLAVAPVTDLVHDKAMWPMLRRAFPFDDGTQSGRPV